MDAISCLPPLPAATYHLSTSAAIARALHFSMPAAASSSSELLEPCSSSSPLLVPGSVGNWFASESSPPMVESVVVASTPGPGNASKRQQQQQLRLGPRAGKRRAKRRPSKRAPTTYISTDTANFRFMVQHVTGAHHHDSPDGFLSPAAAASSLLLAQEDAAPYGCGAAFSNKDDGGMIRVQQLHQHRQQQVQQQHQASFPTLDSWSVIYNDHQPASLSLSLIRTDPCRPRGRRRRRACAASWTRTSPPPRTWPPRRPSPSSCAANARGSRAPSAASTRTSRPPRPPGSRAPPTLAPASAASAAPPEVEASVPGTRLLRRPPCPAPSCRRSCGRSSGSTPSGSTRLEALVGNLEDATFSIVRQASKLNLSSVFRRASNGMERKQEKLLQAVDAVRDIERELVRISTSRPQWTNLIMAVDSRVDKTLAILRPQALTDYRALLAALGWPPSLSSPDMEKDKYSQVPNPLVLMNEANKEKYSESFLALCALQHVQANRDLRQCQSSAATSSMSDSKYFDKTARFDNGLWAVDELVQPIVSRMEYHFSKWSEQPELIFALVYKITKDFMDGVDDILQPLIDQARLVGLSAKESWVTGMVKMLIGYLETQIFPALVSSYRSTDDKVEVHSSWMHLNDLMVAFDKKMQLLADSGIQIIASISEGLSRSLSVFSIYSEHSDWLQIWADIELSSAQHKLKSEMEDETSWLYSIGHQDELDHQESTTKFLLSTREDYKAPPVSEFVIKTASSMIERSHALPNKGMKIQYTRSTSSQFLNGFFIVLHERCDALQLSNTALEDESLLKASYAINAARYCEYVLRGWDEDATFSEMGAQHQSSFFADEIAFLVKLGTNFLEQIMSSILLEFEDLSWDYVQSIGSLNEQNQPDDQVLDEENLEVSPGFVASLETLSMRTTKLKLYLNSKDFLDLWRSIAEGLDYFIYSSIKWGEVKFSCSGVIQLRVDTKALLRIFKPYCLRPEAFFPFVTDSLRLLTMREADTQYLLEALKDGSKEQESCLRQQGLHHVDAKQAVKVLRSKKSGR